MASTSFSQRRDTQNEGFTKEITKKLNEVKNIKIIEIERDLIVNTLEYFKEVSISYSSKSGDILSNLNMQIEVCKEIFKYIDMKKEANMLTKVKMTMSLKLKDLKDLKEEARLKQYLQLDLNIFKKLEVLKEEMKVLVAYEQVENLTIKQGEENKKFLIDLIREKIKNSELKMKKLETAKDFPILGIIEEIGIFEEPFTDDYYKNLTEYIENKCVMPLEIFKEEELSFLFDKLTNLLHHSLDLCKNVILLIELNNILELIDDKNGDKNRYFKTQLSDFLNLVKKNDDSKRIIIACKNNNQYLSDDFVKLCTKIDDNTLNHILSQNKSTNLLSLDEILKLLKNGKLTVEMFNYNRILTDDEYIELRGLYRIKRKREDVNYDLELLLKIVKIIDNRYDFNLLTKVHSVVDVVGGIDNIKTLNMLYKKITSRDLNILRKRYNEQNKDENKDENYFKHLQFLDKQIMNKIKNILDFEEKFSPEGFSSEESSSGGRKVLSIKKEICGKLRCIYKIPGSRKEHIKYKRRLITVTEYKKLMKAKS
jgi:hypothetical protein